MPATSPTLVTPSLLEHGRRTAGFETELVARRLKVTVNQLEEWESGVSSPSLPRLRKLSKLYNRSLAYFFLADPPVEQNESHDFRTVNSAEPETEPALTLEIRRLKELRVVALGVGNELGRDFARFSLRARVDESHADVATRLRSALGVSISAQMKWSSGSVAFKEWRSRLELLGAWVVQFPKIPVSTARGFSIAGDVLPVIAVNSADAAEAKTFTLLHELVHVCLRGSGVCDLSSKGNSQIEKFCNLVAAEILVPATSLADQTYDQPIDVAALAKRYKVSREAMALRLVAIKRLTWADFERYRTRHVKAVEDERDEAKKSREEGDGGPSHAVLVASRLGRPVLELLITALHDGVVSAPAFRDYTNVRPANVSKLESALGLQT